MVLEKDYSKKELIVFDLDGTLTVSKSTMDRGMGELLGELLKVKMVAVIGGGNYAQFESQLLSSLSLPSSLSEKLFIFPTSGSAFYRYVAVGWEKVYEELLTEDEKTRIYRAFERVFSELNYEKPEVMYGVDIEDRTTQISFSPLGQQASPQKKEEWREKYNPLRLKMRDMLAEYLPDFEVRAGGITTIDVTRKGIDKAYGIHKMEEYLKVPKSGMFFIGDAIYPGGNDYAAVVAGVDYIKVTGPEETKMVIRGLLGEPLSTS